MREFSPIKTDPHVSVQREFHDCLIKHAFADKTS